MADIIENSVPAHSNMPVWPESVGICLPRATCPKAGDPIRVSRLDCKLLVGAHMDTPRHFVETGCPVDQLPLDTLIGQAVAADFPKIETIAPSDLTAPALPPDTRHLRWCTRKSELWSSGATDDFQPDCVFLKDGDHSDVSRVIKAVYGIE